MELVRIYGIKNGRPEKVAHNEPVVTQDDLAEQLDVSKAQLKRYKSLTDLIPELQHPSAWSRQYQCSQVWQMRCRVGKDLWNQKRW